MVAVYYYRKLPNSGLSHHALIFDGCPSVVINTDTGHPLAIQLSTNNNNHFSGNIIIIAVQNILI